MRPFLFWALLLSSSLCFAQKKMVIVGDSLTEGYGVAREAAYPALLEVKLHAHGYRWDVVNAGVSGSTTASAVSRIKWLSRTHPDMILLALGANDGLRGLKVSESEKNLAKAIALCQQEKIKVALIGLYMPPNYGKDYATKFKKMFSDLAGRYHIPLMPFLLDKVGGDPKLNQADGIHPNEKGHEIIAEHLYQFIKDKL